MILAGSGKLLDWSYRPLDEIANADNTSRQQDITSIGIHYKIANSIKLQLNYQYQNNFEQPEITIVTKTYFTRNLINLFTQLDGDNIAYIIPIGGILDLYDFNIQSNIGRGQVNFDKTWQGKHQLVSLLGAEISEEKDQLKVSKNLWLSWEITLIYWKCRLS